jgi:hypothetical protein
MDTQTVSVLVPSYNHARYLKARLDSIVSQSYRHWEVILLDDGSTDDSLAVASAYGPDRRVRIVRYERNSGSPFARWRDGLELARGDLVWIAESDDSCDPDFLATLIPAFRRPDVKLAYANSKVVDARGVFRGDYATGSYLAALSPTRWRRDYVVSAQEEINEGLGIQNTVLSISAVVFRKFELIESLERALPDMRLAGDWLFIAHALLDGSISYCARPLNHHRRHEASVIATAVAGRKLGEFFHEFHRVQSFIVERYPLSPQFETKWERYLRTQWNDLCPGRPFADLEEYYPVAAMRARIRARVATGSPAPCG